MPNEGESGYLVNLEALRKAIDEGINSGPSIPAEIVFARLRRKYQAMIDDVDKP